VVVNAIFADPKVITRVAVVVDKNLPVLKVKPFRLSVPSLKEKLRVTPRVQALPRVKVAPEALKVIDP
jgi:hypothetical protein